MPLLGCSVEKAGEEALVYMRERLGGCGGCVVVTCAGDVATPYTTERMPWAYVKNATLHWGMNPGQHFQEPV